jgi:type II secretion system protein G
MYINFSKARGFTLIELLTVIAIIGILASIVMTSLSAAQSKGRDAKRVADIRTIQLALEEYYNDNGNYPTALSALTPNYLPAIPTDPKNNGTSYFYSAYNALNNANCVGANKPIKYHLAAAMESTNATNSALNQDADWPGTGGGAVCTGTTADFNGNAPLCSGTTAQALGVDNCYDETN